MKRIGKLWSRICDFDNIRLAIHNATKDAPDRSDNSIVLARFEQCVEEIHTMLKNETYKFHPLRRMVLYEPKERIIDYMKTYPDKILITCVLNVLKGELIPKYIENTYSSIKGRGLHKCCEKIKKTIKKNPNAYYVLTDIKKYYSNIDHELCKQKLRMYIKDTKCLRFLDAMVDTHNQGLAIGLSLSSYLANLNLCDVDRWIYKALHPLLYVRYMDDQLMIFETKEDAHRALAMLHERITEQKLELKNNAIVAPISSGISVIGYNFYPTHTLLRKNIRERMKAKARVLQKTKLSDEQWKQQMAPYYGWCIHANCRHLMRKIFGERYKLFEKNIMQYERLRAKKEQNNFFGLPKDARVSITQLKDKDIVIWGFMEVTLFNERKLAVKFCYPDDDGEEHMFLTRSDTIREKLKADEEYLPCVVTIREKKTTGGKTYLSYE